MLCLAHLAAYIYQYQDTHIAVPAALLAASLLASRYQPESLEAADYWYTNALPFAFARGSW
jgi:hypothetical protein